MAAPTTYTETALAEYMRDGVLLEMATALGWSTAPDDYQDAVDDALLLFGVDAISEVTGRDNIKKLRALAKVAVWRTVMAATTGDFDFSADGGNYNRSQVNEAARKALALAESEAMAYGLDGYEVVIDAVSHIHDPYAYVEDDDRVIP